MEGGNSKKANKNHALTERAVRKEAEYGRQIRR